MKGKKQFARGVATAVFGAFALLVWSCRSEPVARPLYPPANPLLTDAVFTSSREIRAILVDGDSVWMATPGGVFLIHKKSQRKFTTLDGLPTNEIRALRKVGNDVLALSPRGAARFDGTRWQTCEAPPQAILPVGVTARAQWRGGIVSATVGGLELVSGKTKRALPLPPSTGSHTSALLARGNGELWAALFGDGLWVFDGKTWKRPPQSPPEIAAQAISLAEKDGGVLIGTRRAGIWHYHDGQISPASNTVADEPFDHNAQAMTAYKGALFVSTLEDGLAVRTGAGWRHALAELSSNAPRQLVEFHGLLYVRHGGGAVDSCDGFAWRKNVFPALPRRKTLAIAADDKRLYLGQWGGWSEWDGKQFKHRLDLPELQGVPPMALLPDGGTLWFATQSKGIAEIERATGKIRWHDERLGLPDDWITCLAKVGNEIFAGTFVGGLARWDGAKWNSISELKGQNVTALEPYGQGGIFIATRHGVWQRDKTGKMTPLRERTPWLESEAQALLVGDGGVWIGARTGVFWVHEKG